MKILVTQPYVPAYRVPLFEQIAQRLSTAGHTLVVASGTPAATQALRGDDTSGAEWFEHFRSIDVPLGSRFLKFRRMPISASKPDLVVSELEALNTFAWLRSLSRRTPLILWGHGKPYVNSSSWLADHLEWSLVRRASHVMTYTEGGREFLLNRASIAPHRVTAIGNSTDTRSIRSAMSKLTPKQREEARDEVGEGPRVLFVGGLDSSKRIDFLLEAADEAVKIDPSFKLILVGKGELTELVAERQRTGTPVVRVAEARGERLVALASTASAIWMPGRVGLVAVDAAALGLPLHTTRFAFHAPEIELLEENELSYLPDDPAQFAARSLEEISSVDSTQRSLRETIPTIETTAGAFVRVILSQLPS